MFVRRKRSLFAKSTRVKDAGLTLLEILIVTALIAGLAAFLFRNVFRNRDKAMVQQGKTGVQMVLGQVKVFMTTNNNQCPASLEDLVNSKDLSRKDLKDPWNRDYVMRCPGTKEDVEIFSKGPDGQEGTTDDLKSWDE